MNMQQIIGKVFKTRLTVSTNKIKEMIILPFKVEKLSETDREFLVYYIEGSQERTMKILEQYWNECFEQLC